MKSMRDDVFAYVKKKYKTEAEYPWMRFPGYAVFHHGDNRKLFASVMDVSKDKLGLPGAEIVDILDVKMRDPLLADLLIQQEGYARGYHIGRGNWISVLLDGTVAFADICRWVDESYLATASNERKKQLRPPKEWIIPANPKYYDIQNAFKQADEIDWKQGAGIKAGDTVFMYVAAPVSAVLYKCRVMETGIPYRFDKGAVHIMNLMRIKLLRKYPPDRFTFDVLGEKYGIFAVRGPRGIPEKLSRALK